MYMQCKSCLSEYVEVGDKAVAVICDRCVTIISLNQFPESVPGYKEPTGRPPGWHFMKEYVDKNGNVFHKGIEQSDLKGTLSPTKIKPIKKRKKKSNKESNKEMFELAKKYKEKQKAKREAK